MDLGRLLQVFSMQLYIGGSILILEIVFHNYSLIYIYIHIYTYTYVYIYIYIYLHIYINTYILTRDMCICISMGPQSRTINLGLDSWAWEDRVLCVILRWGFKLSDFGNSFRKNLP